MDNLINEIKELLLNKEVSLRYMDDTIEQEYKNEYKINSWDFINDGNTDEYINIGSYAYCGLGEDYDISLLVEFQLIKENPEDIMETIIQITHIGLI